MGPPAGQGDWAASVHDYNFNANGHISIGDYLNHTLPPARARALIQSNNNLITHAGGVRPDRAPCRRARCICKVEVSRSAWPSFRAAWLVGAKPSIR